MYLLIQKQAKYDPSDQKKMKKLCDTLCPHCETLCSYIL